jgi:pantetheine-phosphate adenylyltransferase
LTKVLIPGSFDPLHNGHIDVIESAARAFGSVVVAAMVNPQKTGLFPIEEREAMIVESLAHLPHVSVEIHRGLVVDVAIAVGADFIVKGLRTPADFEVEMQMAQTNKAVAGVDTVFVPSGSALGYLSSRFIREIAAEGRDVSMLVPAPVAKRLHELRAASP